MIGCFARVCIGQNPDRQNEYRMTVIKGIITGQPYLVDASPTVPKLYTDQYVLLAHGKAQKQWPFNNCSDSKFTEREFNRWKAACATDAIPYPSRAESHKLCDNINLMINHHLTSQEINEKVAKRDKYSHMFAESATAPKRTNADEAAEKIRMRNEKIRKQDAEDRRKEFSAKIRAKNALMKKAQIAAKAAKENGGEGTSLKVPKNEIDALFSEGSDVSRAASPAPSASGTRTPQQGGGSKHRTGRFTKMTMDDDVIGDMGLTIDVEI
jgi:RNA polymerase-associated protein RTF1